MLSCANCLLFQYFKDFQSWQRPLINLIKMTPHPPVIYLFKSTTETLEKGVKYIESCQLYYSHENLEKIFSCLYFINVILWMIWIGMRCRCTSIDTHITSLFISLTFLFNLSFFGAIEIEILLSIDFYGKAKFTIHLAIYSA